MNSKAFILLGLLFAAVVLERKLLSKPMKSTMSSTTIWEEKTLHLPDATTIATNVAVSVPTVIASSAAPNLLMI
ncbi:hypothetical protein E5676_scaffold201G00190 [Cucumis melo var. makuwa]|uniref:Uncharacterized protein n=1 Tax=Cucumis melo var. makuwa TaxID=1194695 RepID=A0A5D3BTU2_CUCMM|nr:hypothetical protein E6C27_scaffold430G00660 [Cucumis melo var. makuwa]TYK02540.1 hypothetical protein E5676_scaffold201G00190 [Cucumis melo var. makuwa]